jgi:RimJ/RimL family protein N-acetyltransferase
MSRAAASPRIQLGPIRRADAATLFGWINDPDLVRFNAAYQPTHESTHRAWLAGLATHRDRVVFAIRLARSKRLIGVCQLTGINPVSRQAELQIRVGDDRARGRGLGLEAVRHLLVFGFNDLNLHRISLQVFATNKRAITTYQRAGFTREGTLRDGAFINGRFVDVLVMSVLEGEVAR